MIWHPVVRMTCRMCDVMWHGDEDCWICGGKGIAKTVSSQPQGAHVYDANTTEVNLGGGMVRL